MFQEYNGKVSVSKLEESILAFWHENHIFEKTLKVRKDNPLYVFYEGPPTANGRPGIHHILSRTIKDIINRYKTMTGYHVPRRAGWDTHGLPVEIAVEKQLGLTQKNQIDAFGIDKFNNACRDLVNETINSPDGWRFITDRMGYWLDLDNAYITYKNEYIESVWWSIKTIFEKGLIYRGFKIVPQSPTIETPLSSHELSQNYQDVKDPNCYVKVRVTDSPLSRIKGAQLLLWTTTPWTLISNTALAVGKEIDYVLVRNSRTLKQGDQKAEKVDMLVLAKSRLEVLDGDIDQLATFKGSEIVGSRYEQIFPFLDLDAATFPNVLTVLPGDFVSTDDGSGIVHLAPAFGQDDYEMSRKFDLPVLNPVTPGGRFKEGEAGEFSGRTVKTFTYSDGHSEEGADKDIVIALKRADKIYRSTNDYLHSYPHCWRTDNPVIYYARDSWFINSPAYKDRMVDLNNTINWQPPEIGKGRFGNWLEDVKEWSLSRDRYWGTPLPIWVSEDGVDIFAIGSIEELKQGEYEHPDGSRSPLEGMMEELDLHRPFVDQIVFERGGKLYRRTPEIIDVWYDSGSMPFAQLHYPFENKELFEKSFPADFICEGVDQTRGWFYTLHNIATALFDKPAFKNIIVNDLILDNSGKKMSKSVGNVVLPLEIIDKYGVDPLRWYLMTMNNPWLPKRFDEKSLGEVSRKFFDTLLNTYSFFALYANIDKYDGQDSQSDYMERPEIDRWILSRLYTTVDHVTQRMEGYDITQAMRPVSDFLIDDVSNWYVRRNRRRFWKSGDSGDKRAAYQTLHEVLLTLSKLIAPFAPFVAEAVYRNLKGKDMPESVHMTDYPAVSAKMRAIQDEAMEYRMKVAQRVVRAARALRNETRLRVRQPLQELRVFTTKETSAEAVSQMADIIRDEINVKEVNLTQQVEDFVTLRAKADFKVLGPRFGKSMKPVAATIQSLDSEQILTLLQAGKISLTINGRPEDISVSEVEVLQDPVGTIVSSRDLELIIGLQTRLTPELEMEGLAREFVNRIQNLRKDSNLDVMDRINIYYSVDAKIDPAVRQMSAYIKSETLAVDIFNRLPDDADSHQITIDSLTFPVMIRKVEGN